MLRCRWFVPAAAVPAAGAASTQFWVYRSNVDPTLDTQAGLAGPLVIARPGGLGNADKPKDVDKEIFLMLQVSRTVADVVVGDGGDGCSSSNLGIPFTSSRHSGLQREHLLV